jgi:hypothetical protein
MALEVEKDTDGDEVRVTCRSAHTELSLVRKPYQRALFRVCRDCGAIDSKVISGAGRDREEAGLCDDCSGYSNDE